MSRHDWWPVLRRAEVMRARRERRMRVLRLLATGAAVALLVALGTLAAGRVLDELGAPYEGVSEPAVWPEDDPCYDPKTGRVLPPVLGDDC